MKVTVVGAGAVGATTADNIARKQLVDELVLLDIKEGVSQGKAIDLMQTASIEGFDTTIVGSTNDYTIVFTFKNSVTMQGASVTSGTGTVNGVGVTGNVVTVNLLGVTTAQTIVVTLAGVSDGINISDVQATMGVLVGDTNGDGLVNVGDTILTKSQSGNLPSNSNFREDVNTDGLINIGDTILVKRQSGTGLGTQQTPLSKPAISTWPLITPLPPGLDNTVGITPRPRPKKLVVPLNTIRSGDQ